jgi:cell division transport system ATP-binding protein
MIYFDSVSKHWKGDLEASIEGVSFGIEPGEFVTIVGHSGAGKTTLLRLLLADVKPTSGTIFFEGTDINKLSSSIIPEYRRRIGTVFQDFRLLPNKTAFENIAFAMEVAGKSDHDIVTDVPYVLDLVGLSSKGRSFPGELSGGEKQRLAIARAIINQPEVLIADEPTGNLDPVATSGIIDLLKKINDLGTTVILTTHNEKVREALGKRILTMEKGKLVDDVKHHHKHS